jgi:hypothetical protein
VIYEENLSHFQNVRRHGDRAMVTCPVPAHEDKKQSCGVDCGDDGNTLIRCHAGCSTDDVLAAAGLTKADLFDSPKPASKTAPEVVYSYEDESGALLHQVVRQPGKRFVQRRPDGNGWSYKLNGVRRVPYRLRELIAAPADVLVFAVEGEKDADNARKRGLVASTNAGGVGSSKVWDSADFRKPFTGRDVAIIPDNDPPGEKHALHVAAALRPIARSVKIVRLPGVPEKGDLSDYFEAGHSVEELRALAGR